MFKFDQKEVTAKDFYKQRQITDISMIDVNKVAVSDKVACNNGKDTAVILWVIKLMKHQYHCLSRRLKIYLVMACHNTKKLCLYNVI